MSVPEMPDDDKLFSVGEIARRFGTSSHRVRVVLDRLELGEKLGQYRAARGIDLPLVGLGLAAVGAIPPGEVVKPLARERRTLLATM